MRRLDTSKHSAVLARWAAGERGKAIAAELGLSGPKAVSCIVSRARDDGDTRAVLRDATLRSGWTDARTERLRAMLADGVSDIDIAHAFGITRNSLIGKRVRLGLFRGRERARTEAHRPRKRRATITRSTTKAERIANSARARAQFEAVEIVDLPPDESAVAVKFEDLNAHTCRWPLGDPRDFKAMRFCGAEPVTNLPYCARHCQMSYQPPAPDHRQPFRDGGWARVG
ncbi:MAG: GcrA family cell cycle regulator [Sulfuricaulis sp.]|nr:GcrA family cell cycle regulator [Sulfuricaulis sp.]